MDTSSISVFITNRKRIIELAEAASIANTELQKLIALKIEITTTEIRILLDILRLKHDVPIQYNKIRLVDLNMGASMFLKNK